MRRWLPTPLWDGRRWELVERGVFLGAVVVITPNEPRASLYHPKYEQLPGPFRTIHDAAEALVRAIKAKERPWRKKRR